MRGAAAQDDAADRLPRPFRGPESAPGDLQAVIVISRPSAQTRWKGGSGTLGAGIAQQARPRLRHTIMDRMGVDIQVISPNILHPGTLRASSRKDALQAGATQQRPYAAELRWRSARPAHRQTRLGAAAGRRDGDQQKMERAVPRSSSSRASSSASRIGETDLGAPNRPFWRRAQALDVPIFVHAGRQCRSAAAEKQPADLARAAARGGVGAETSLIYEGVMRRVATAQDRVRVCSGFHYSVLCRPLPDWIYPPRLDAAAEERFQHLQSAVVPLRQPTIRSSRARTAGHQGGLVAPSCSAPIFRSAR